MSMVFVCGNCECSPCECELQDVDYLNLKLKPGKYYKKIHWPNEVYFKVDTSIKFNGEVLEISEYIGT